MMKIHHPDLPEDQVPATVTREAFVEVWEPLGWVEWEDTSYAQPPLQGDGAGETDTSSDEDQ